MRGRRKETDMEGVYQAIRELSPHELQSVGENSQNRSHNLAVSGAQQATSLKLVRQNASGIHENAPFREQVMKNFLGWGGSTAPL